MNDTRCLVALLGMLALAAFAISAGSLAQLASEKRVAFPWLLPFILDGGAVGVAYVAYSAACDRSPATGYSVIVAAFTGVSVTFNVCHVWSDNDIMASVIHGTPPVILWVFLEVLLSRLRQQRQPVTDKKKAANVTGGSAKPAANVAGSRVKVARHDTGSTGNMAERARAEGVSVRTLYRRLSRNA